MKLKISISEDKLKHRIETILKDRELEFRGFGLDLSALEVQELEVINQGIAVVLELHLIVRRNRKEYYRGRARISANTYAFFQERQLKFGIERISDVQTWSDKKEQWNTPVWMSILRPFQPQMIKRINGRVESDLDINQETILTPLIQPLNERLKSDFLGMIQVRQLVLSEIVKADQDWVLTFFIDLELQPDSQTLMPETLLPEMKIQPNTQEFLDVRISSNAAQLLFCLNQYAHELEIRNRKLSLEYEELHINDGHLVLNAIIRNFFNSKLKASLSIQGNKEALIIEEFELHSKRNRLKNLILDRVGKFIEDRLLTQKDRLTYANISQKIHDEANNRLGSNPDTPPLFIQQLNIRQISVKMGAVKVQLEADLWLKL